MRIMVFDTETDGLIQNTAVALDKQPRVIEFYGLVIDEKANELEVVHHFMNTERPVPEEITKITGYKTEDIKDKPVFKFCAPKLKEAIEACDRVVAHNASYDCQVMDFNMKRSNMDAIKWPEVICTVELTHHIKGHRLKLADLYQHLFGETFENAHTASADVRALTRCYLELNRLGYFEVAA